MNKVLLAIVLALGVLIGAAACQPQRHDYWVLDTSHATGLVTPEWEDEAIKVSEVVREVMQPKPPFGGVIHVEATPWRCWPLSGDPQLCAGQSFGGEVKVLWYPTVWRTALAHELCHEALCMPDCTEASANACAARVQTRYNELYPSALP